MFQQLSQWCGRGDQSEQDDVARATETVNRGKTANTSFFEMKDLSAYSCSTFKEKDKSNSSKIDANADSNDRFSFAIAIFLVVHRRRILVIVLSPPNNSPNTECCDWVNTNGVQPINFPMARC